MERQVGAGLIEATYFCPDLPESGSMRRKPETGMLREAERDLQIDLPRSFFVGDKAIDAECGRRAGMRTIIVQTGINPNPPDADADWMARDLGEAVDIILEHGV